MPKTAIEAWEQYLLVGDKSQASEITVPVFPLTSLKKELKRPDAEPTVKPQQPEVNLAFREKEAAPLEQVL